MIVKKRAAESINQQFVMFVSVRFSCFYTSDDSEIYDMLIKVGHQLNSISRVSISMANTHWLRNVLHEQVLILCCGIKTQLITVCLELNKIKADKLKAAIKIIIIKKTKHTLSILYSVIPQQHYSEHFFIKVL